MCIFIRLMLAEVSSAALATDNRTKVLLAFRSLRRVLQGHFQFLDGSSRASSFVPGLDDECGKCIGCVNRKARMAWLESVPHLPATVGGTRVRPEGTDPVNDRTHSERIRFKSSSATSAGSKSRCRDTTVHIGLMVAFFGNCS